MSTRATQVEKPECKLCEKQEKQKEWFSDIIDDLLYAMFNPFYVDRKGRINISDFIKKYMDKDKSIKIGNIPPYRFSGEFIEFFKYDPYFLERFEEYRIAKKLAWEEIKEKLKKGEIKKEDLSISSLVSYFYDEIIKDLKDKGFIDDEKHRVGKRILLFSSEAERIIGEKILRLALSNLRKTGAFGIHETKKQGFSILGGEILSEYDPFVHTFDMIDLQETLIKSALRNSDDFFDEKDLVVRVPKHCEKCTYVMLIDSSDSMRGKKIIGAIEAAIALRRAIKGKDFDKLHVVAFNHKVRKISENEILNLEARGRTDIGLALKMARDLLKGETGNKMVFLITDGEPTSSFNANLTPWKNAIAEARKLRNINSHLVIIMLGREYRFIELCNRMAKASGSAHVFYFSDPLDLKNFFVREFYSRFA